MAENPSHEQLLQKISLLEKQASFDFPPKGLEMGLSSTKGNLFLQMMMDNVPDSQRCAWCLSCWWQEFILRKI